MPGKKYMRFVMLLVGLALVGCSAEKEPELTVDPAAADFERLLSYMEGSFSSREQAQNDSNYFDIRLETVRIWEDRDDGVWLYVEQAAVEQLNKPNRQRVYHLAQVDSVTYRSTIYAIPAPERFVRHWRKPEPLVELTPDSLIVKPGCGILLRKVGSRAFSGSTVEDSCLNDWGGAVYATSEVMITEQEIYSWDRGFDAEGNQLWGPERGGYVFKRKIEPALPGAK